MNNKNITQNEFSDHLYKTINSVYYEYWEIDESEYPIADHTVFITYRGFHGYSLNDTLMGRFNRWNRNLIKQVTHKRKDRYWIYERQPVGMYAMDYNGSRSGRGSSSKIGPHIHSLWVLHPETKSMIVDLLRRTQLQLSGGSVPTPNANSQSYNGVVASNRSFHWEWYDHKKSIRDVIHYSLKGIMHANGFYPGSCNEWSVMGPDVTKRFRFPAPVPSPLVVPRMVQSVTSPTTSALK